jgi:Sec-independent protein secretion pathway component TatC
MQLHYTKVAVIAFWVITVIVIALTRNLTSTFNWVAVAALAAIPPVILWRLWKAPAPTTSENIREAFKD